MIVNHITPPNKFTITSSDLCITRVEKLEFGKAFPECSFEWLLLMVLCNRNGLKIFFFGTSLKFCQNLITRISLPHMKMKYQK